jgi:hypothetical protein
MNDTHYRFIDDISQLYQNVFTVRYIRLRFVYSAGFLLHAGSRQGQVRTEATEQEDDRQHGGHCTLSQVRMVQRLC